MDYYTFNQSSESVSLINRVAFIPNQNILEKLKVKMIDNIYIGIFLNKKNFLLFQWVVKQCSIIALGDPATANTFKAVTGLSNAIIEHGFNEPN